MNLMGQALERRAGGKLQSLLDKMTGSCEGVLNIIKEETVLHDPYLQRYSENPYVNAVLAGKAAYAAHCGIVLESNVELGAVRLKTIEFCAGSSLS